MCQRPNAWIEHLVRHGKNGKTFAQLRASYTGNRGARIEARSARNQGRSQVQDLTSIPNICTWARVIANQPLPAFSRRQQRLKIVRNLIRSGMFPNRNPGAGWIQPRRLRAIFQEIDKVMYKGTIQRTINNHLPFRPALTFGAVDEIAAGDTSQAWLTVWAFPDGVVERMKLFFGKNMWVGANAQHRRTDGVAGGANASILETMVIAMCHELTHALIFATCPDVDNTVDAGHHHNFKELNYALWGHSKDATTYDNDPLPIRAGVRVGVVPVA